MIRVIGFTLLSLVLYAVHFLGFASARHDLSLQQMREKGDLAPRWNLVRMGVSPDRARLHGHVEEDGWRRRSLHVGSKGEVEELGEGRFHVTAGGNLWLASSDNTKITENGRDYELVVPRKLPLVALLLPLIGFAVIWWRARALRPLVASCVGTVVVIAVMMAQTESAWELRQRNEKFAEMDGDLWHYRVPALRFVEHGEVSQQSHRAFGYPLLVGLILRWGEPSFEYLSHVQQIASLVAAWLLAAAVALALRRAFRLPWWIAGVGACLAHWLYVFSPSAIHLEAAFRPEIMVMIGSVGYLLLVVCAVVEWRRAGRLTPVFVGLLVAMTLAAVSVFFIKQAWGLAMLSPMLFAVAIPETWRTRGVCLLITAGVWAMSYLPLAQYQGHLEERYDREQSLLFTPRYLLFWQADIIRPVLARRAAAEPDELFITKLHEVYEAEFTRERSSEEFGMYYGKFGFVPEEIRRELGRFTHLWPAEKKAELYVGMFIEGVATDPVGYAVKVVRQLAYYYGVSGVPYPTLTATPNMRFQGTWEMLSGVSAETIRVLGNGAEVRRIERAENLFFEPPPRRVISWLRFLGRALPWMWGLVLPFAVVQLVRITRGRSPATEDGDADVDALTLRSLLFFVVLPFLVLLTFAMLTSLSIDRFISMALPLTLFSQLCVFAYVACVLRQWFWRRRVESEAQ